METFIVWISVIGAICLGVMALAIFFTLLAAIQRRFSGTPVMKFKKFFENSEWLDVHVSGNKTISRVKFVGFSDPSAMKGVPYQLNNMVVFEASDGQRILLRADSIRMIEEIRPDTGPANS